MGVSVDIFNSTAAKEMSSKLLLVAICAVILGLGDSSDVSQEEGTTQEVQIQEVAHEGTQEVALEGTLEFQNQEVAQYNCPEYGVDFLLNDIDFASASSWQDCGKICELYNGCYFWTYRTDDNTCCLKSSDDGLRKV